MPSISLTNPRNIWRLDFTAVGTQKLGGSIQDLSQFVNLTRLTMPSHHLVGSIPDISANTHLFMFQLPNNKLTGSIPDLSSNIRLKFFYLHNNLLTGSIPDLSSNNVLEEFTCNSNQLTGSIPDLSSRTHLTQFKCQDNNLTAFASGFGFSSGIAYFNCARNNITGQIPNLSGTNLTEFYCNINASLSVDPNNFAVPNTLLTFYANDTGLSQASVDAILAAFNSAGASDGFLYIGGVRNAIPTGGFSNPDYIALVNRNWSVTIL